jgi:hypothetical protein
MGDRVRRGSQCPGLDRRQPGVGLVTDWLSWRVAEAVLAAIALATLLASRAAASAPGGRTAPRMRGVVGVASARRWIGAELIAYGRLG